MPLYPRAEAICVQIWETGLLAVFVVALDDNSYPLNQTNAHLI